MTGHRGGGTWFNIHAMHWSQREMDRVEEIGYQLEMQRRRNKETYIRLLDELKALDPGGWQSWFDSTPDDAIRPYILWADASEHEIPALQARIAAVRDQQHLPPQPADLCPLGGKHEWMTSAYVLNYSWCGKCGTPKPKAVQ